MPNRNSNNKPNGKRAPKARKLIKIAKVVKRLVHPTRTNSARMPSTWQQAKDFGGRIAGQAASAAGGLAKRWFSSVTGMGAYRIRKNSLMNGPPLFNDEPVYFTHREFIADVTGSTTFASTVYSVNPGMSETFPWLSGQMAGFEQYIFEGLLFEFKSTSANALNSTNTALGTVIMATNYDALDQPFSNKQQMEAYEFAVATKPSESCIHPVECDPRKNTLSELYVRANTAVTNGDLRMYDLGNFTIATAGMQAAATIGELWVTYKVKAIRKKLSTPTGDNLGSYKVSGFAATGSILGAAVYSPGNNLNITWTSLATGAFTFDAPGRYLINYRSQAATTSTNSANWLLGGSAVAVNFYIGSTGTAAANGDSGDGTNAYMGAIIIDTTGPATVRVPQLTIVGSCYTTIVITQIPGDLAEEESKVNASDAHNLKLLAQLLKKFNLKDQGQDSKPFSTNEEHKNCSNTPIESDDEVIVERYLEKRKGKHPLDAQNVLTAYTPGGSSHCRQL